VLQTLLSRHQFDTDRPNKYPLLCRAGYLAKLKKQVESEEVVETCPKTQVLSAQVNAGKAVAKCGGRHRAGSGLRNSLRVTPGLFKEENNRLDCFSSQPRSSSIARRMLDTITATRMARLSEGVLSRNGQTRARRSTRARTQPRRDLEAYPPLPDWGDSVFSPALAKNRSARERERARTRQPSDGQIEYVPYLTF
jgi:hypothetical protein